ncbi:CHASE3 domain-containing protein [Dongia soli]|uniref:histidine kinase n=1 Tax=Dongia soli TaxID=600628 RepID=A0ABU5EC24_9PROT|nr:CHASE3 domain-containing protein [Dongia soli]MDY0883100.1 CHASE3 domain-containing protein [Dongia soli]
MLSLNRMDRHFVPLLFGFVLLFLVSGLAIWLWNQQQSVTFWVQHALEVENHLNQVLALATDAETGQRGYLLTGRDRYLAPYETARQQLLPEISTLGELTTDNSNQRKSIERLRALASGKLGELEEILRLHVAGKPNEALAEIGNDTGIRLMDDFRKTIATMRSEEERLLHERSESANRLNVISQTTLIICALLVVLLAILSFMQARRRYLDLQASTKRLRREVAERAAAEEQVRQLQKMEAIGQLTGGIAHDFNNMLAIIIGSLELAKRRLGGMDNARLEKYIDNAAEGARHASVLTARLLAFSRQQPLSPQPVDINRLVGGISELLRRTLGERVQIETVLAGGLWITFADLAQLESAIVNLSVNARDAMPSGGKLTIETANSDLDERYARAHSEVEPGQYVMLSITDTGVGMTEEVMRRAFEPFFTTKSAGKGTGLGLSQVFGFVKQSHGHIKIYSECEHGTTVKIYLPRYNGSDTPEDQPISAPAKLPGGRPGEVILVVEDESQVRQMTIESLRELGYSVIEAALPEQALQQLEQHPEIDLIFTDIVMPGMTGRQLADKVHETRPEMKVLYTTGYTRNAIVHNGVLDRGTAFLPKPFTIDQLATKIRDVLDGTSGFPAA